MFPTRVNFDNTNTLVHGHLKVSLLMEANSHYWYQLVLVCAPNRFLKRFIWYNCCLLRHVWQQKQLNFILTGSF